MASHICVWLQHTASVSHPPESSARERAFFFFPEFYFWFWWRYIYEVERGKTAGFKRVVSADQPLVQISLSSLS